MALTDSREHETRRTAILVVVLGIPIFIVACWAGFNNLVRFLLIYAPEFGKHLSEQKAQEMAYSIILLLLNYIVLVWLAGTLIRYLVAHAKIVITNRKSK